MFRLLFGYSSKYEFHGPLEIILGYIDFYELESKLVYVCKNFYLASKCSYLERKIESYDKRLLKYLRREEEVDNKSFDEYLVRLYNNKCIRFTNQLFCDCACKGLIKIIKLLLLGNENIDPSFRNNSAISYASKNGHYGIVKLLMSDSRVDPSDNNNYALRLASEGGHYDIVKLLMSDSRVDPSDFDNAAIICASDEGYVNIVKLLMSDSRVDPSANDNQSISGASLNGHISVVKLLMSDSRVDPSANDNDAIKYASYKGHIDIVKLLMSDSRVDPSSADGTFWSEIDKRTSLGFQRTK